MNTQRTGEFTQHNWRTHTEAVVAVRLPLRNGAKRTVFGTRYTQKCTRCGTTRQRGDQRGDQWTNPAPCPGRRVAVPS